MSDLYPEETKIRELSHLYYETKDEKHLTDFYKKASILVSRIYDKYCKNLVTIDYKNDVVHDTVSSAIVNLQKGKVNRVTAWTRYLTILLRNRLSFTNKLNPGYEFCKSSRIYLKGFAVTGNVKDFLKSGKSEKVLVNTQSKNWLGSFKNDPEQNNSLQIDSFLAKYLKECREFLPFDKAITQNFFMYISLVSLFEIVGHENKIMKKFGFPKRYGFLMIKLRIKFKEMLKDSI